MFKGKVTDVFFDLDHTLWDFERNSGLAFRQLLTENQVPVAHEDFLRIYSPINLEYWKIYRENKISQQDLRFQRLQKTFSLLGVPVSEALIHTLAEQYIERLTTFVHLVPNAREILEYLHPSYRLHIITNGFREVQARKLQRSGIDQYFRTVTDSEIAGVKKPNTYIFQMALEKAGVVPENSLMVGDNLEADIFGARAAGFHTLLFNCGGEAVPSEELMITDLIEIKSYL